MAADLHIHVFGKGELTDENFRAFFGHVLGSKWFSWPPPNPKNVLENPVRDTESVWVGEVSWLKAAISDDPETYVPGPVAQVSEIIGEGLPIIDEDLIDKVQKALSSPNTTAYDVATFLASEENEVIEFLQKHAGKQAFTISW